MGLTDPIPADGGPATELAGVDPAEFGRVLVVAPMKSASTYVANVLKAYLELEDVADITPIDWSAEHSLNASTVALLRGRWFCFNFHMLPYASNLAAAAKEKIALVHLWRNLGDLIVSVDDHHCSFDENWPMLFMLDHRRYRDLPPQERLAYVIDALVPWYVNFYLSWRQLGVTLYPYEWMVLDRKAYFIALIEQLTGASPDDARLDLSLAVLMQKILTGPTGTSRFNVGQHGRSGSHLEASTKRRLEERVLAHPDRDQLEILLWELPWNVPALGPRAPLDGKLVIGSTGGAAMFVSRGVAHPVTESWIRSRAPGRRAPEAVDKTELEAYPVGELLV